MRPIESIERRVRSLGRDVVPPTAKRHLWFYYMEGKRMVESRSFDGFASVHLEVNTDCNRTCSYCSNHLFPKKQEYMDLSLYRKVIDELAENGYRGQISPNLSSEPTLHPRLPELMAYARRVKDARIVIYTDGDFLNRARFDQLRQSGVDAFIITQHGQNAPKPLMELMVGLTPDEGKAVIYQTLDGFNLFNRGIPGLIAPERRTVPNPCFVADYDLTILANGDIAQCCNDFNGEHTFGNVKEKSILEIWNDPEYKAFRSEVRRGQFKHDVCQACVFDTPPAVVGTISPIPVNQLKI